MTTIKNKRLSQYDREKLVRFAGQQIKATADTAALDAAYERAADVVRKIVEAQWPQKDMAVLARYEVADVDRCIYVSTVGTNYDEFNFREGDKRTPLRPTRRYCSQHPVLAEGDDADAVIAFWAARDAAHETYLARLSDFKALIAACRTFNEVTAAWPAAEQLRPAIVGTDSALVVMSADVLARIQSDPAAALAA